MPFGYGFSEDNFRGPARVHWTVTAQLWALDGEGNAVEEVAHTGLSLPKIDAAHQKNIGLTPPDRLGFYRFDLEIWSRGRELGSWSSYLTVVRPSWRVRLAVDRAVVHPGQRVLARLENLGTAEVGYGEYFKVARRREGGWSAAPGLTQEFWEEWAGGILPGGFGTCNAVNLPDDVAPGRYRIVKYVTRGIGVGDGNPERVAVPFTVAP